MAKATVLKFSERRETAARKADPLQRIVRLDLSPGHMKLAADLLRGQAAAARAGGETHNADVLDHVAARIDSAQ